MQALWDWLPSVRGVIDALALLVAVLLALWGLATRREPPFRAAVALGVCAAFLFMCAKGAPVALVGWVLDWGKQAARYWCATASLFALSALLLPEGEAPDQREQPLSLPGLDRPARMLLHIGACLVAIGAEWTLGRVDDLVPLFSPLALAVLSFRDGPRLRALRARLGLLMLASAVTLFFSLIPFAARVLATGSLLGLTLLLPSGPALVVGLLAVLETGVPKERAAWIAVPLALWAAASLLITERWVGHIVALWIGRLLGW